MNKYKSFILVGVAFQLSVAALYILFVKHGIGNAFVLAAISYSLLKWPPGKGRR